MLVKRKISTDGQQGKDVTFQSVILAGVYDVKTLKLKLHPQEGIKI